MLLLAAALPSFPSLLRAAGQEERDWPQILGPRRDGAYRGGDVTGTWPEGGPRTLWSRTVGRGFSGPAVARGRLILFHRLGDEEVVECLEAAEGRTRWSHRYPTSYRDDFGFDEGPRATPTIAEGRVVTFGAQGVLTCLDLETGKRLWSVPTHRRFGVRKGFFGAAGSPTVHEGRVLVGVGGQSGAGIVAFDLRDGSVVWKARDDEASYSSPVVAEIGGEDHALFLTREGLVDLDPADGRARFAFRWRARMRASVNAATPLVIGDRVFISASYQTGARLVRVRSAGYDELWSDQRALSNHYATSVHHRGFLYGFHGRQEFEAALRCVEVATGKVRWSEDGFGCGAILTAGSRLWIVGEEGTLTLAEASPLGFRRLGSTKLLDGTVRALPALAAGRLYARSEDRLVCADLRGAP